jgi:PAS domain S-box-containing protein
MPQQKLPPQSVTEEIYKRSLELLEERRHSEELLYNISEAVISLNANYTINLVNKSAEDMLGAQSEDLAGKSLNDVARFEDEKGNVIESQNFCFTELETELDNLVLKRDEANLYYLKLHSITIESPSKEKECILTLTDITKQKKLEKSKDEFISIASHELRTPMTIVKSYIWMLDSGKGGDLTEKQKDYLKKAQRGVERMLAMINDTLNVSKIDQGKVDLKIEEIDLKDFILELEPDFKIKAEEKGLFFKLDMAQNANLVFADRTKFREILTNLVGNSIKFTQQGGITLEITTDASKFTRFKVIDSGKGIKGDDLKRLFKKFGRLDNSYQTVAEAGGTGLGLYITKSLVENMGGTIGVESEGENKGTIFWFTLCNDYLCLPQNLRKDSVVSLTLPVETEITSICPV